MLVGTTGMGGDRLSFVVDEPLIFSPQLPRVFPTYPQCYTQYPLIQVHRLSRNHGPNLPQLLHERGINFQIILNFFARMNHCGVISSTHLLSDRRIRNTKIFTKDVHGHLSRLNNFFFTSLLVNSILFYVVEVGDDFHHFFRRKDFLCWFVGVLNKIAHLRKAEFFTFCLAVEDNGV